MDMPEIRNSLDRFDPKKTTYGEQLALQLELLYVIATNASCLCLECSKMGRRYFSQDYETVPGDDCGSCVHRPKG